MRNDLPSMNPGRAMAQASHASNAFVEKWRNLPSVEEWQQSTAQGFGTAIVLSANAAEIESCLSEAQVRGLFCDKVVDPEWKFEVSKEVFELIDTQKLLVPTPLPTRDPNYVVISKKEWACAYIFGEYEETYWVLGRLPLHP